MAHMAGHPARLLFLSPPDNESCAILTSFEAHLLLAEHGNRFTDLAYAARSDEGCIAITVMTEIGENALNGIEEYIEGPHTFTVTVQEKVRADGMMVQIKRAGKSFPEKPAKRTGQAGWSVKKGDEVLVYRANTRFE